ncbi:hypothetical protein [Marinagarivorans cellulosilyticus]|nr:hypothetical protein [Marinagarivorans cellulosilyticus]
MYSSCRAKGLQLATNWQLAVRLVDIVVLAACIVFVLGYRRSRVKGLP